MGHTEGVAGRRGRCQVGAASPNVTVTGVRPRRAERLGDVRSGRGLRLGPSAASLGTVTAHRR